MIKKSAFTLIELVFVIVILGILAGIAIPRLGSSVNDAHVAKGRSDVAAIRAAIVSERQSRLLTGNVSYINHIDKLTTTSSSDGDTLFDHNGTSANSLLQYGIISGSNDGDWRKTAQDTYKFKLQSGDHTFEYDTTAGTFRCTGGNDCADLTN
ncbi:type II secretion system protein [Sulfuricurvum sp.]|uniref:type II secretion system protein n=1 Tax=Sulfuricurvum sp. TaxID=2025608 RepID=UPI003BB689D5